MCFFCVFFSKKTSLNIYTFDFQSFVKIVFEQLFLPLQRQFFSYIPFSTLINGFCATQKSGFFPLKSLIVRIRPVTLTHTLGTTLVLFHHALGFLRLMLIVGRLGLVILFGGAFRILIHLTLGLAHRARPRPASAE